MQFLNPEKLVYDYLKGLGYPVMVEIPAKRPQRFVTVELVGGSERNQALDQALLAVQCWAGSRWEASELARQVDADMRAGRDRIREVCRSERTGFTHFPDSSGHERYQMLYTYLITV